MAEITPLHHFPATRLGAKAAPPVSLPDPRPVLPPSLLPATKRDHALLELTPARLAPLRVLVVEDDTLVRHACAEIARDLGYQVESADSVPTARLALKRSAIDILLLDLKLPGGGGFALLEEARTAHPRTAVVVMTAYASVPSAVEAMRTGAGDYLPKPFALEELTAVLERAAERRATVAKAHALQEQFQTDRSRVERLSPAKLSLPLMGQDAAMEKLLRILSKVAFTQHPVLILGESGTGKEAVARAIHFHGPSAAKPFVPVDCNSLSPAWLERELFGAAETMGSRTGLLSTANGGTLYFDEIADLNPDLQGRLLRALQEKEVRPAPGTTAHPLRTRVLASTGRDLTALVESGRFRKDLFYRLNVVNMRIPPLRERPGDIPLLAAYLLERCSAENGEPYSLSDEVLRRLVEHDWPGNIRELEHALERSCSLSSGPVLHLADLPTAVQGQCAGNPLSPAATYALPSSDLPDAVITLEEMERRTILRTVQQLHGDKLLAAKLLGIGKTTLYRKLKEYGLADDLD